MAKLTLILSLSEEVKEYEEKNEAVCVCMHMRAYRCVYICMHVSMCV